MPIKLEKSLAAWKTPDFEVTFKQELRELDRSLLPLQAALSQSSHVSDSMIDPVILLSSDTQTTIKMRVGIFYAGVIAGSCCADDPTPLCEQPEYCELLCDIDKANADITIELVS